MPDPARSFARSVFLLSRCFLVVTVCAVATTSCSGGGSATGAPGADGRAAGPAAAGRTGGRGGGGAVPVSTAKAVQQPMAVNVRVAGNVEASSTVAIRALVTGELQTVGFTEGQDVTAGQLLFVLDPRPFELAVRTAETQLARDESQFATLDAQAKRSVEMLAQGLVAPATHEATLAQAAALKGAMNADQVQIDNAKLQLTYTKINAPVSGRTGALLVHEGSLVRNSDTNPLVVINQIAPIFVSFAIPARLISQLHNDEARGALRVLAVPAGTTEPPVVGSVTFIDNSVDQSTDTIRLKATFPNRDKRLWPGAFVDVTLRLSETPNAVVVPNAAVQPSQQGQMIFVVKPDQTVEVRQVTVGWTEGDETVIAKGLAAGETVVTDGQLRLTAGARIALQGARSDSRGSQP